MQRIESCHPLNELNIDFDLSSLGDVERIIFLDIETTGLSKEASKLYLIGAACISCGSFHLTQWFADSPGEERKLLEAFSSYAESFDTILTFNGDRFDLPYIKYRAERSGLSITFDGYRSLDLYKELRPFKKLLGLPSAKQRDIERLLGIERDDKFTGRDLIPVYYDYVREHSEEKLKDLLCHNSEDILGLLKLLPALNYRSLTETEPCCLSHSVSSYKAFDGTDKSELMIELSYDKHIPKAFKSVNNGVYLAFGEDSLLFVRIPLLNAELKHFYKDYKNYYYLPLEDFCIHKNAASGVSKENREKAKKETCYIRKSGLFISDLCGFSENYEMTVFKAGFSSSEEYLFLEELIQKKALCTYVKALINSLAVSG